jgi:hypothetical protein
MFYGLDKKQLGINQNQGSTKQLTTLMCQTQILKCQGN